MQPHAHSIPAPFTFIFTFASFLVWFSDKLPELNEWLTKEVQRVSMPNLVVGPVFDVSAEMLEADGVHLLPAVGAAYLGQVRQFVAAALTSPEDVTLVDELQNLVSSDSDDDVLSVMGDEEDKLGAILKIVKSNSKKLSSVKPLKDALTKLAVSSSELEAQVRLRRQRDNLVFARIKEEADSDQNRSKENRVAISGLARASDGLTTHQAKKEYYSKVVMDLVAKACPSLEPKPAIVDIIVSLRRDQANPSIEAIFDSPSGALAFRKAASTLAKDLDPAFASLFFSNTVTQATRVRIEIMKAIAKKLTTTTENAFVQGFISRPVLRYLVREGAPSFCAGTGRSYSFVDCVTRYGDLVQAKDLTTAYKRAGATFRGAMEQYFVLLSEVEDVPLASGSNHSPIGARGGRGGRRPFQGYRAGHRGTRGRKRNGSPQQLSSSKKPST